MVRKLWLNVFPGLLKDTKPQLQKSQQMPNRIYKMKSSLSQSSMNLQNTKDTHTDRERERAKSEIGKTDL